MWFAFAQSLAQEGRFLLLFFLGYFLGERAGLIAKAQSSRVVVPIVGRGPQIDPGQEPAAVMA
jgi:hypothetical protein